MGVHGYGPDLTHRRIALQVDGGLAHGAEAVVGVGNATTVSRIATASDLGVAAHILLVLLRNARA